MSQIPAALYNLGSGSWLAWANGAAVHYVAIPTGPTVQLAQTCQHWWIVKRAIPPLPFPSSSPFPNPSLCIIPFPRLLPFRHPFPFPLSIPLTILPVPLPHPPNPVKSGESLSARHYGVTDAKTGHNGAGLRALQKEWTLNIFTNLRNLQWGQDPALNVRLLWIWLIVYQYIGLHSICSHGYVANWQFNHYHAADQIRCVAVTFIRFAAI